MIKVKNIERLSDERERYRMDVEVATEYGSLLIRRWLLRRDAVDVWRAFPPVVARPDGRPMASGPTIISDVRLLGAIRDAALEALQRGEVL